MTPCCPFGLCGLLACVAAAPACGAPCLCVCALPRALPVRVACCGVLLLPACCGWAAVLGGCAGCCTCVVRVLGPGGTLVPRARFWSGLLTSSPRAECARRAA